MRIHRSVTSLSWIPSEAIEGLPKLPFAFGTFHYDTTPPDHLGPEIVSSIEALRVADRFRCRCNDGTLIQARCSQIANLSAGKRLHQQPLPIHAPELSMRR